MPLTHFRPRGDIKANWTAANPILKQREMGIEWEKEIGKGSAKIKIGDGSTAWNNLDYGIVDDITQKTIKSFVATTGNNALSVGDTIAKAAGKLNAQRDYWMTLTGSARAQAFFDSLNNLSNDDFVGVMEWLNSNKIDTNLRYGGLDSNNNNQVLTAPAGKQLKELCDNNSTEISKLNSNFSPKIGTITSEWATIDGILMKMGRICIAHGQFTTTKDVPSGTNPFIAFSFKPVKYTWPAINIAGIKIGNNWLNTKGHIGIGYTIASGEVGHFAVVFVTQ